MSAFVVDQAHIDYLIEAGLRLGIRNPLQWQDPKIPYPAYPKTDDSEAHRRYWEDVAARVRKLESFSATRVGSMLWAENHRSVSYRYSEAQVCPEYEYRSGSLWDRRPLSAVGILKALKCYEYQSCETDDWEQSEAYAFCRVLQSAAIAALPGYEAAPWEVHDPEGVPA